jgi:phosphohistidine phosphatase SixA
MAGWRPDYLLPHADFETSEWTRAHAFAGRLADQLELDGVTVAAIVHSEHRVARQTGQVYARVLGARGLLRAGVRPVKHAALTPGVTNDQWLRRFGRSIVDVVRITGVPPGCASVVIGHQPQLTDLATEIAGRLPAGVLPIDNSEVACIRIGAEARLVWLLTSKSKDLLVDLRGKVQSKYDVAKFLLGALVVTTGITLGKDLWHVTQLRDRVLVGIALVLALLGVGFTVATLFAYDRLLMPREFWGGDSGDGDPPPWSVKRPPSETAVVLFHEMVHTWTWLFMPAIWTALGASTLFMIAIADHALTARPPGARPGAAAPRHPPWSAQ